MVFTAQTVTIYATEPYPSTRAAANERALVLKAQGLTDAIPVFTTLPDGKYEVTRNWTTIEAADDWVVYITAYDPLSVTVVRL